MDLHQRYNAIYDAIQDKTQAEAILTESLLQSANTLAFEGAAAGIGSTQGIQESEHRKVIQTEEALSGRIQDVLLNLVIDTTVDGSSLRSTGRFLRNLYRIFSR